jgi:hypothetical protein
MPVCTYHTWYSLFYVHGSVHHESILWKSNEMQQVAVPILFHCKITLHVSGALCTHRQEYIKLQMQPLVQVERGNHRSMTTL